MAKTAEQLEADIVAIDAKLKKLEADGLEGGKKYQELEEKLALVTAERDALKEKVGGKKPAKPEPDAGDEEGEESGDEETDQEEESDDDDWLN